MLHNVALNGGKARDVNFDMDGRLFHYVVPLYKKLFCPLEETFIGSLGSVAVRLRLYKELVEFVINRFDRYCGTSLSTDIKP